MTTATEREVVADYLAVNEVLDVCRAGARREALDRVRAYVLDHSRARSGGNLNYDTKRDGIAWHTKAGEAGLLRWDDVWSIAAAGATPERVETLRAAYPRDVRGREHGRVRGATDGRWRAGDVDAWSVGDHQGSAPQDSRRGCDPVSGDLDPIRLVNERAWLRVYNFQGASYAEGRVIAYCDQPTILVEGTNGERAHCPVGMRRERVPAPESTGAVAAQPTRQPAYDAVYEVIRQDPEARMWRAVAVALAAALPIERRAGREDAARDIETADTSGWPGGRGSDVDGCQERAAAIARAGTR